MLQSSCVDGLPRKRDENMIKEIINLRIFVKSKRTNWQDFGELVSQIKISLYYYPAR